MNDNYKVCLLKPREFLHENKDLEIIKTINFLPKVSSNLEINNRVYHITSLDYQNKLIGVRAITFNDEPEEELHEDDFTCPYCGYEDPDAFELPDEGTNNCGNCGSEIEYERVVEIKYTTIPQKKNEPIVIS